MNTELDVAVIGGGVIGAALAYGMADGHRRIAIFDEGDRAFRASRGNFGLVWVQGKGVDLPGYATWTRLSASLWPELANMIRSDTGIDVALDQPGGLHLCLSEDEADQRKAMVARHGHASAPPARIGEHAPPGIAAHETLPPCSVEMLEHADVARLIPGLGSDVVAASFCDRDGHVNPLKLLRGLHAGFVTRGGRYFSPAGVSTIEHQAGGFVLESEAGRFAAAHVVIAAGLGTQALAAQVGIRAPLRAQRGHIIALRRMQSVLRYPVDTLRQTDEATLLIGDSQDEVGIDDSIALGTLGVMAERAVRMLPALHAAIVQRTWAALRILTPDGFPLYESSRTHPGAFAVSSHSGITLAAVHALRLGPQLATGSIDPNLRLFSSERFGIAPRGPTSAGVAARAQSRAAPIASGPSARRS